MADFVAVLKKTLEGLGDTTPQTRERVYAKARDTISSKLAAINPPPPQVVVDRQIKALEDAIRLVEAEYAPPPAPQSPEEAAEDLESILASLESDNSRRTVEADGVTPAPLPAPAPAPVSAAPAPYASPQPSRSEAPDLVADRDPSAFSESASVDREQMPETADRDDFDLPPPRRSEPARSRGALAPVLVALIVGVVVLGGGYALWMNRDAFTSGDETAGPVAPQDTTIVLPGAEEGTDAPEDEETAEAPAAEQPEAEAPAPEVAATEPPAASPAAPAPQKFTQRLLEDGSETDAGPAGGQPGVGEGTSVATAIIPEEPSDAGPPAAADPQAAPAETAEAEPQTPPAGEQQPALAVGQRAIFYEERTSSAQGSAESGSVVWSLVQESPGGDLPPEPAVRGEATVPSKDLQLRITIRRNADATLPASHIIELIFLTPESFEGGGIENVLRMTMKDSEEAPGQPLLGIPAKIADGFFLIALTDGEREITQNTTLLSRDQWIDVPIVYRSGRRALITMEKGLPGARVFEDAIKAWQAARSG